MRNITNEKPDKKLTGRLKYTTEFVDVNGIKGKKVLDIGCGYGWFENFVLENKVFEVIGTEISDSDLITARENIKSKKSNFIVAGALKLPFPDSYFDTVVSWEVIEHIPEGKEHLMFREVYRILKPGGEFYISTPNSATLSKLFDPAYFLIGHRHYDVLELIKIGQQNKFLIEKFSIKGGIISAVSVLNMYFSKWILRRESLMEDYFAKKETQDYKKDGFYNIFIKFRKI